MPLLTINRYSGPSFFGNTVGFQNNLNQATMPTSGEMLPGDYIVVVAFARNSAAGNDPVASNTGSITWRTEGYVRQSGTGSSVLLHARYNGNFSDLNGTVIGDTGTNENQAFVVQYFRHAAITNTNYTGDALDNDDGGIGSASTTPFTRQAEVTTFPYCLNQIIHWTGVLNSYSSPSSGWSIALQQQVDDSTTDYSVCLLEQVTESASDPGLVSVTPNSAATRTTHSFCWRPSPYFITQQPHPPLIISQ